MPVEVFRFNNGVVASFITLNVLSDSPSSLYRMTDGLACKYKYKEKNVIALLG